MTLISFASRIHFADGVVEEALRSEMEVRRSARPLIVTPENSLEHDTIDRVLAGLPPKSSADFFRGIGNIPSEDAAAAVAQRYRDLRRDCLIAVGGACSIDLAKVSRFEIMRGGALQTRSNFERMKDGSADNLPILYAVPDTLGLAAAVSPHAAVILSDGSSSRLTATSLIPTVTICDPNLTQAETPDVTISAAVESIARCVETYLSSRYHPPASGMALDGLERAVSNLEEICGTMSLEVRREIMAACLNSSLAQQKCLGVTQTIGNALCVASGRNLDRGAMSRLILPEVLTRQRHQDNRKLSHLRWILNIDSESTLTCGIQRIFEKVPLPGKLSALGLADHDFEVAADLAATDMALVFGSPFDGRDDLLSMLHAVR